MSGDEAYKVKIEGPGLSLERRVSKEVGDQVVVLLLTGRASSSAAPVQHSAPTSAQTHMPLRLSDVPSMSIREFLNHTAAKRVPDKITTIGVYLGEHQKQDDFTRDDLVHQFEAAAESVPKNLARDIKWTLKVGWITPRAGKKGAYYVTQSGKTAVAQKFSHEVVKRTRGMTSGTKKTQQKGESTK